jgi:hypothetical protein
VYKRIFCKKLVLKSVKNSSHHKLLHIMLSEFRYNKLISFAQSYEQFVEKYLEDQIQFLNMLPYEVKKEIISLFV